MYLHRQLHKQHPRTAGIVGLALKAVPFREGVVIQITLAFHPLDGFIDFARIVLSASHWTRKSYSLSRCSGKRRTTPSPAF